jgi:type I restriction-modification system DNA methylase subunit
MNQEKIKEEVSAFIQEFKADYSQHRDELEANTETKLIEPLFAILGWTPRDFVKRKQARRGTRAGFVDYSFQINHKDVFFLEVKRMGVPLEREADTQVISYALSRTNVPFAISTNFERMKIFCVEQENAANHIFRVFNSPDDYVNNFQDLLYLHKENFEQGLLLKKAEEEGRLRRRISIDQPLLEDLMTIRKLIANDVEGRYPGKYDLNEREEIVQRIIDRLIFIRKCEDVTINLDGVLLKEEILNRPYGDAYRRLRGVFRKYNETYNGGLFAVGVDNDCDKIDLDGEIVQRMVGLLYTSKDGNYVYNFDWITADVLGQVYEQYLGKILAQSKSGKAQLRSGQVHKREQGIYYTPTYIVDYMLRSTLAGVLKDSRRRAETVKVVDPACGSGSFLIKAFDVFSEFYAREGPTHQTTLDTSGVGITYRVKEQILHQNIFGVDLDEKAVEIAQLNLLLKIAQKGNRLPLLRENIRRGNSLSNGILHGSRPSFSWNEQFAAVMNAGRFDVVIGNPPYVAWDTISDRGDLEGGKYLDIDYACRPNHKDGQPNLYLFFLIRASNLVAERGVISFILPQEWLYHNYAQDFRDYLLSHFNRISLIVFNPEFKVFQGPTESVGTTSLIVNLWRRGKKGVSFCKIESLDAEAVSQALLHNEFDAIVVKRHEDLVGRSWVTYNASLQELKERIEQNPKSVPLADKDYFAVKGGFQPPVDKITCYECTEREFMNLPANERTLAYPAVQEAGEIQRYSLRRTGRRWVLANDIRTQGQFRKDYPSLFSLLSQRMPMTGSDWWHFPNIRNFELIKAHQKKILCPRTASGVSFALDDSKSVFKGTNTMIISLILPTEYVLGILNSKLSDFWYSVFGSDYHGGKAKKYEPEKARHFLIPIIRTDEQTQQSVVRKVEVILSLKQKLGSFGNKSTTESARVVDEITRVDKELDDLIYKIYGITREDRKLIQEGRAQPPLVPG